MALRQAIRRGSGVVKPSIIAQMARGGGGHHGPPMPPFARVKPVDYKLDENHELVWDDGVAPETCIDFDAPHVSTATGFMWWTGGLLFFASVYGLVALSEPDSKRLAVPRSVTLPSTAFDPRDICKDGAGGEAPASDDAEEDEDEDEGDEDEDEGDEDEDE